MPCTVEGRQHRLGLFVFIWTPGNARQNTRTFGLYLMNYVDQTAVTVMQMTLVHWCWCSADVGQWWPCATWECQAYHRLPPAVMESQDTCLVSRHIFTCVCLGSVLTHSCLVLARVLYLHVSSWLCLVTVLVCLSSMRTSLVTHLMSCVSRQCLKSGTFSLCCSLVSSWPNPKCLGSSHVLIPLSWPLSLSQKKMSRLHHWPPGHRCGTLVAYTKLSNNACLYGACQCPPSHVNAGVGLQLHMGRAKFV